MRGLAGMDELGGGAGGGEGGGDLARDMAGLAHAGDDDAAGATVPSASTASVKGPSSEAIRALSPSISRESVRRAEARWSARGADLRSCGTASSPDFRPSIYHGRWRAYAADSGIWRDFAESRGISGSVGPNWNEVAGAGRVDRAVAKGFRRHAGRSAHARLTACGSMRSAIFMAATTCWRSF